MGLVKRDWKWDSVVPNDDIKVCVRRFPKGFKMASPNPSLSCQPHKTHTWMNQNKVFLFSSSSFCFPFFFFVNSILFVKWHKESLPPFWKLSLRKTFSLFLLQKFVCLDSNSILIVCLTQIIDIQVLVSTMNLYFS